MSKIRLLDCTLRDGGYINNWKFGETVIGEILTDLTNARIDIIETGFLTDKPYSKDYSLYSKPKDIEQIFDKPDENILYVGMIAIGEKEIHPDKIPDASESFIRGIRITFHQHEIEKAFSWGKKLMDKGYKLFMQPVGSANYADRDLLDLIEKINFLKPYAFYLVDTLGVLYQNDVKRKLYLIDSNLDKKIALGLHSHNNVQMSFANAQDMISFPTSREIIIDTSIFGMGRGAGNLCTELLTDYLNVRYEYNYDVLPILESIDERLMPIYTKTPWGYSVAYFLASSKGCHPNYASHLLAKQTISVPNIASLLDQIPEEKRLIFDRKYIEDMYQQYQINLINDIDVINELRENFRNREILVLAPGKTIQTYKEEINAYIKKQNPYIISVNFIPEEYDVDLVFVSSRRRYQQIKKYCSLKKMIFTSNIHNIPEDSKIVNYSDLLNSSIDASDSAGMMLMKLLVKTGVRKVDLAGFDGFYGNSALNYYKKDLIGSTDPEELSNKQKGIEEQFRKRAQDMQIKFITPTSYVITEEINE